MLSFFPKVSILIPCYNAERWIAQAIESALNQTYANKEVIVIDDGSTDGSLEIIKQYKEQIHWETQVNQGGNYTRNRLLELSEGEWLQYLDADDYLLPEKIERQIDFLNQTPDNDVVYSPHITEELINQEIRQAPHILTNSSPPHDLWLLTIRWQMPQTGGLLFHKQALIDINGWNEDLKHCQDYDLYVRLLMANKRFGYLNHPAAVYRWWCSGTVTHRKILEIYRDRLVVQDTIEQYLSFSEQLHQIRQDAINQARFEYARRIYLWDKQWSAQIESKIKKKTPNFEPSINVAPKFYRLVYKIFGFTRAEHLAQLRRNIWKQPAT